jgi:hypothetical protein
MTAPDKIPVFALAFGVSYAAIYVICTEFNLPLLTYHPVTGEIGPLWQPPKNGPVMYWYGWMLTALVGAIVFAGIAVVMPEPWLQRLLTFACVGAAAYLIFYTVALFIYDRATVELEFLKSRWLAAAAAAVTGAILAYAMPPPWYKRVWHGWIWVVPLGALAVLAYYLTPYFTR